VMDYARCSSRSMRSRTARINSALRLVKFLAACCSSHSFSPAGKRAEKLDVYQMVHLASQLCALSLSRRPRSAIEG
jgi:hypothetical protein